MSIFHKEVVEKKVVVKHVLEKAFAAAYFLCKEHVHGEEFETGTRSDERHLENFGVLFFREFK